MTTKTCRGRDSTQLQEYINDPAKQRKAFAMALSRDDFLNSFNGQINANECVFSYPDSEWYSIFLLDNDGNKYWNHQNQRYEMYYFKLAISPNKKDAFTRDGTTDVNQTDLQGKIACSINEKGNCAMTPAPKSESAKPKKTVAPKKAAESAPTQSVAAEVMSKLQTLSINPSEMQSKESVPKEYFEQMKNKMLIVQWMIEKMEYNELVQCIKRGSLSPEDVRKAEAVLDSAPSGSSDFVEEEAVEAAASLPAPQVRKMLKKITKEDLVNNINSKGLSPEDRLNAVMALCQSCGKRLEMRETKKGPRPYLSGKLISLDDALDKCAEVEARRIQERLASRKQSVSRALVRGLQSRVKGKAPAVNASASDYIVQINAITDRAARKKAIIDFCTPYGYNWDGSTLFDPDGDEVLPEDALEDCAALKASTTGFGRKRGSRKQLAVRKRFKKAVKKCKGKPNFRKCVSKSLSRFGKRVKRVKRVKKTGGVVKLRMSPKRKSPRLSATIFSPGTVKVGVDGNMWVIKIASNGVKRWVKK